MMTTIQKWGNSQGIRFPKVLLREANINLGDDVRLFVEDGRIVVEPLTTVRGRYRLEELLAQIPENDEREVVDWGEPVGDEVW